MKSTSPRNQGKRTELRPTDERGAAPALTGVQVETPQVDGRAWGWVVLELLAMFGIGVAVMSFIYLDPRGRPADQVGVPGYDAFYHIKMAAMLPEVGLVDHFPWLKHVYFSQLNDDFVSHHYGFHVLLMPFVKLSHWLTGDYLAGGRWAISFFFGLNLLLIDALLLSQGVRWRWFWLLAFLLLPHDFFLRHSYVRAISPSLVFMLLLVWSIFRERYVLAGLTVAAYIHLYLGAVVFAPMIVGICAASQVIGGRGERRWPWRLVMWTSFGWLAGLRTYPYFDGAIEFLRMQIFGTGLNPDIAVGAEWSSYSNVWQFAVEMCGPMLAVWVGALVLRIRFGTRLTARELSLVLLNFAFLFLTLKAKRFIEYWPPFCLLSAAFLAAPLLNPIAAWLDPAGRRASGVLRAALGTGIAVVGCAVIVACLAWKRPSGIEKFMQEWPVWLLLATALLVGPIGRLWQMAGGSKESGISTWLRWVATPLFTVAFISALVLLGLYVVSVPADGGSLPAPGLAGWLALAAIGALALAAPGGRTDEAGQRDDDRPRRPALLFNSATVVTAGVAIAAATLLLCANRLVTLQRQVFCGYDLPAIREAMAYLQEVSRPGDVVFTDDWDVFPVLFYHNSRNNYIVGLDPKFTHSRDPELWERYVRITRGQAGRETPVNVTEADGTKHRRTIRVELSDIREHFGAGYVITDRDHRLLAQSLAGDGEFAKLIYPGTSYEQCASEPYLIFKVGDIDTKRRPPVRTASGESLYLSEMKALSVQQGWGELTIDRSVSERPLQLGKRFYSWGLGTHAPLELTYEIPRGFETFEAIVGLNGGTQGRGSVVVSVEVDGKPVFVSPTLTGESKPLPVRISIMDGKRLTLRASPTEDGNRFDHVDWALARFHRSMSGGGDHSAGGLATEDGVDHGTEHAEGRKEPHKRTAVAAGSSRFASSGTP